MLVFSFGIYKHLVGEVVPTKKGCHTGNKTFSHFAFTFTVKSTSKNQQAILLHYIYAGGVSPQRLETPTLYPIMHLTKNVTTHHINATFSY